MKNILFCIFLISFFSCTNAQQPQSSPTSPLEIKDDKGIIAKLPPWSDEEIDMNSFDKRNVLSVLVNKKNELIVREKKTEVKNLKSKVKEFISNPKQDDQYSEKPNKAIVSLRNDKGTDYKTYLTVYNEIKEAYNELRNEKAKEKYDSDFENLNKKQKTEIKKLIPMIISEAEPTDFD